MKTSLKIPFAKTEMSVSGKNERLAIILIAILFFFGVAIFYSYKVKELESKTLIQKEVISKLK